MLIYKGKYLLGFVETSYSVWFFQNFRIYQVYNKKDISGKISNIIEFSYDVDSTR